MITVSLIIRKDEDALKKQSETHIQNGSTYHNFSVWLKKIDDKLFCEVPIEDVPLEIKK